MVLVNASRVSGILMPQTLAVKLQLGPKLDIKRKNLAMLSRAGVKRGAAPANAMLMRMTNGDCLLGRLAEKTVAVRTEFGNISVAWTAVQSIRPDSGKGLHVLKMRTGAVHRGQLGGPHVSFEIAGMKQAIKVKTAEISSIASLDEPADATKN